MAKLTWVWILLASLGCVTLREVAQLFWVCNFSAVYTQCLLYRGSVIAVSLKWHSEFLLQCLSHSKSSAVVDVDIVQKLRDSQRAGRNHKPWGKLEAEGMRWWAGEYACSWELLGLPAFQKDWLFNRLAGLRADNTLAGNRDYSVKLTSVNSVEIVSKILT